MPYIFYDKPYVFFDTEKASKITWCRTQSFCAKLFDKPHKMQELRWSSCDNPEKHEKHLCSGIPHPHKLRFLSICLSLYLKREWESLFHGATYPAISHQNSQAWLDFAPTVLCPRDTW